MTEQAPPQRISAVSKPKADLSGSRRACWPRSGPGRVTIATSVSAPATAGVGLPLQAQGRREERQGGRGPSQFRDAMFEESQLGFAIDPRRQLIAFYLPWSRLQPVKQGTTGAVGRCGGRAVRGRQTADDLRRQTSRRGDRKANPVAVVPSAVAVSVDPKWSVDSVIASCAESIATRARRPSRFGAARHGSTAATSRLEGRGLA